MGRDEDELPPRAPAVHALGQPLDTLSVEEIGARIAALRAEIERLEKALGAKEASRASAAAFFKPAS